MAASRPAAALPAAQPIASVEATALARFETFGDVVALVRARRDMKLLVEIEAGVRLVRYAPGRIEFEPGPEAAPDLAARIGERLRAFTGARWGVSVVSGGGAPSIAELRTEREGALKAEALTHPLVQAVLEAFPGAKIRDVRPPEELAGSVDATGTAAADDAAAAGEEDETWDPFEEDR